MKNNFSILVTGGCGFIGTSLIKSLLIKPVHQIRILDNLTNGRSEDLEEIVAVTRSSPEEIHPSQPGVFLIYGDIRDADLATKCAKDVDAIVHLAANTGVGPSVEDPRLDMDCNVRGTFNLLEAARLQGVRKFIFASSSAPAGEVEPPIHEELAPHPVSPYGASKLAGEGYCSAYYRTFGIDTISLRFGNVYGPRSKNKSSVVAKFIRQALAGENCKVFGDGTQTRDFLYIDDLVRAVISAIDQEIGGEIFQIATGAEHTVKEVAELICNELAGHGIKMRITHDHPRLGDVKRSYSDTSKAERILNWRAQVSLQEGIAKTVNYFLSVA